MDQQERGPDTSQAPAGDAQPGQEPSAADDSANDSTWGLGAASALENLRRHHFGARRSKVMDDEEPASPAQ